jgi:anionic cell wall polymer biosynthesis LytR-Cps2A-Psr (LCP) family protein
VSGKHGRPKPPRRAPEPVGVGAAAAQTGAVGAAAAQTGAAGYASSAFEAPAPVAAPVVAAPMLPPPPPSQPAVPVPPPPIAEPVIHNRPLPDFDRDNPLGVAEPFGPAEPLGTVEAFWTVEPSAADWAEQLSDLARSEPEPAPEPAPQPAPQLASLPAVLPLGNEILPSSAGKGGSAGGLFAGRRRLLFVVLALVVVVGLVAWLLAGRSGTSGTKAPAAAATGRTQTTLLLELKGNLAVAVDSALLAHDSANHDGAVVLVPSNVQTQVPGFGSMPFGQALSVGDPNAPTGALADLIGVTVDGSWTLTQTALAALVDKIGGVTVAVDKDVTTSANGTTTIVVPAGTQKLNGANAALFASFQATGEPDQAELTRFDAVLKQVLAGLPKTQAGLSATLASLGAGSTTSFAPATLATFLLGLAADNTAGSMTDQQLPVTPLSTGTGQDAYTLDTAKTATLVSTELAASVPASRKATGNRVYVQNQVGTPGLGETARSRLVAAGFVYVQGQNTADMPNATAPSVVVILGPSSAQIDQGDAVARSLGLPISDVRVANDGFTVADVLVKLGADYKG